MHVLAMVLIPQLISLLERMDLREKIILAIELYLVFIAGGF